MTNLDMVFQTARRYSSLSNEPSPNHALKLRIDKLKALKEVILRDREAIMDRIQAETGKCRSDALMSEIF